MVFVKIPQLGFPAAIALAIGFELGGGYAQEQTVARPYGFAIRHDAPAGTYTFLNPGQGRGPMYTILDGVRDAGIAPGTTESGGLFTGGESAMIWDSPREGSRMEPASPPSIQVVQAPSQQPVQQMAQPAWRADPLRMMRPAVPVETVQAPVRIVQRTVPVAEVALPRQYEAPVLAEPAPVVPVQTYQAPVQQSAPILAPAELAPAPVAIQAPVQQSRQNVPEPEPAPVREVQAPVQQSRQTVPEPNPAPVRAQQPARQPARATPLPVRAPVQQPDSDARVRVAQAIPTEQARTLLTSIIGDITGTATTDTATPTGTDTSTPTGATTRTTNGKTATTTNGKTTTTNGKPTTLPSLIPGSAVSLTGQPDRWLITMVLGFVGYEMFF